MTDQQEYCAAPDVNPALRTFRFTVKVCDTMPSVELMAIIAEAIDSYKDLSAAEMKGAAEWAYSVMLEASKK